MSHTPEPWILFEVGDRFKHQCPASSDRTSLLTTATEDDVQWGAVYSDEDARRIVACVNLAPECVMMNLRVDCCLES